MDLSDDRFLRDAADQLRAMLPPCSPSDLLQKEVSYPGLGYKVLYDITGTTCHFYIRALNQVLPDLLISGYVFSNGKIVHNIESRGIYNKFSDLVGSTFILFCAWRDSMRRLAQHYPEARGLLTQDERATDDDPI